MLAQVAVNFVVDLLSLSLSLSLSSLSLSLSLRNGWLGVKHQIIFSLTLFFSLGHLNITILVDCALKKSYLLPIGTQVVQL